MKFQTVSDEGEVADYEGPCFGRLKRRDEWGGYDGSPTPLRGIAAVRFPLQQYMEDRKRYGGMDYHAYSIYNEASQRWLEHIKRAGWPFRMHGVDDGVYAEVPTDLTSAAFLSTLQVVRAMVTGNNRRVRDSFELLVTQHRTKESVAFMLAWFMNVRPGDKWAAYAPDEEEAPVSPYTTFGDINRYINGLVLPKGATVYDEGRYEREDNTSFLCECPWYSDDDDDEEWDEELEEYVPRRPDNAPNVTVFDVLREEHGKDIGTMLSRVNAELKEDKANA